MSLPDSARPVSGSGPHHRPIGRGRNPCVLLAGALLALPPAAAIDLQPGDVRAPPPGLRTVQLAWQYSERGDRYRDGERQPGDPRILATQTLLRLGMSFELAGLPAYAYAQNVQGSLQPGGALSGLDGDTGLGDLSLLLALWPHADRERRTYVGIGAYLVAPTGSYDPDRRFNLGENRYRTALQLGVQAPLSARAHWMAAVDTVWFGDNPAVGSERATLQQRPLYSAQLSAQYEISSRYALGVSWFHHLGGETRLDGVNRDDALRTHRYQLTASANLPVGRLTLQYGGDLSVENGLFEDHRLILRYLWIF